MKYWFLFLAFLSVNPLFGQTSEENEVKIVIEKTLDFISMEKDSHPDWNLFRNYFSENASFILPGRKYDENGVRKITRWDLETFIKNAGPNYEQNGFKEIPDETEIKVFNGTAVAQQRYTAYFGSQTVSGLNTYVLVHDGKEWKIVLLTWAEDEK